MVPLITEQPWLIFEMLGHGKAEVQWMKLLPEFWPMNDYYVELRASSKVLKLLMTLKKEPLSWFRN